MKIIDLIRSETPDDICTVNKVIDATKSLIQFDGPYTFIYGAEDRNTKIPIFSDDFITVFRLMLSNTGELGGCILQMTPLERELWYDFAEYQNAKLLDPLDDAGFTGDRLVVLQTLNNCIVNEIECNTETYIDRCFNVTHSWEDCLTCNP